MLMLYELLGLLVQYNELINNDEHCCALYVNVLCANEINGYVSIYMNSN